MREEDFFAPPGGAPLIPPPNPEIYKSMGDDNIFRMLEDFYIELEQSTIRPMFQKDMLKASKRSALFFIQLLGGPHYYQEQVGPPNIKARHKPFSIDENAKEIWLDCFYKVLEDAEQKYQFPKDHLNSFKIWLEEMANWIIKK